MNVGCRSYGTRLLEKSLCKYPRANVCMHVCKNHLSRMMFGAKCLFAKKKSASCYELFSRGPYICFHHFKCSTNAAGSFLWLNTHCHGAPLTLMLLAHGCYKLRWQSTNFRMRLHQVEGREWSLSWFHLKLLENSEENTHHQVSCQK